MLRVWKCDYCYDTDVSPDKMIEHENNCVYNPKFKNCNSCKNLDNIYDCTICKKDLDYWIYDQDGNCPGWEIDNIKLLRKLKLKELKNENN